jgi:hypothetical protein
LTQLLNVPGVGDGLTVRGGQLIRPWSEHLRDDVWAFPRRRHLCEAIAVLSDTQDLVSDLEGAASHVSGVIAPKGLLVSCRPYEGHFTCLLELVFRVFQVDVPFLLVEGKGTWGVLALLNSSSGAHSW